MTLSTLKKRGLATQSPALLAQDFTVLGFQETLTAGGLELIRRNCAVAIDVNHF
jgi:hypothetical protein